MKKSILTVTVLVFICFSSECLAQKVLSNHRVGNVTYLAVIDNSALPFEAIKSSSELSNQKGSNGQMKSHKEVDTINKKVSHIFAVAKNDVSERKNWVESSTACATYQESDYSTRVWRLPTQCELMLMYQMHLELEAISGFSHFISILYWSSSEDNNNGIWGVYFDDGSLFNTLKYDSYSARCIRDL